MLSAVTSLLPDPFADLRGTIRERLRRIPTQVNEYGYDPFGLHPATLEDVLLFGALLYHYWFRVETHGIERVPTGRVLLIANHAGQVALDAVMIGTAMMLEGKPPRAIRGMGEFWLPTLPWVNLFMVRTGSVVGTRKNCVDLLAHDEAVIAFPEGVRGMNKLYRDAYQLKEFGHGFMRLALATDTPIVPIAVIGSEEQAPGIANFESLGRLLGAPAFPITLTWPWLGPLGMIPLPVKYHIHFGEPLHFTGNANDEDEVIAEKVDEVKGSIAGMFAQGLATRRGIFW
jgi:1-acyl-sn-glycerol-3-phosphate acyltransferase